MARYILKAKSKEELLRLRPQIVWGKWLALGVFTLSLTLSLVFSASFPVWLLIVVGSLAWFVSLTRFLRKLNQELKKRSPQPFG